MCLACGEQCHGPKDRHTQSKAHQLAMKEEVQMDRLFGIPDPEAGLRRWGGGCKVCSKKALMKYFGDAVFQLPKVLLDKFEAGHHVCLKLGSSKSAKTHILNKDSFKGAHFGAVKYLATTGKYKNYHYDKSMLRFYHDIPDDDGPLPDPNAIGSDGTWWPVVILQLKDDSAEVVREAAMAMSMGEAAKAVIFGRFRHVETSFRVAGVALRDIPTCFMTRRKSFCVAGAILSRHFQKLICIFRGSWLCAIWFRWITSNDGQAPC
eukprot:s593_g14.t1